MTQSERRVRDLLAESDITDESEDLVTTLLTLEESLLEEAPAPSPELAALLANPRGTVTPLHRRSGRVLIAGAVAFGTVAAGGLAAAANELPPGAQGLVADFSQRYLPFELPEPTEEPALDGADTVEQSQGGTEDGAAGGDQELSDVSGDAPGAVPADGPPQEQPEAPAAGTKSPSPTATPPPADVAPSPTISPSPSPKPAPAPSGEPSGTGESGPSETPTGTATVEPPGTATPGEGSATAGPTDQSTPSGDGQDPNVQSRTEGGTASPTPKLDGLDGTVNGTSTGTPTSEPGGGTASAEDNDTG